MDYLIFTQVDKKELNMLYNDINLNITLKEFQTINNKLLRYEFVMIDKFITKDTYFTKQEDSDEEKNHFIDFEIPIFLKDISSFFKNIDIIHYGEFNILVELIDELFTSSREGITYDIKSAYLYVEEVKLDELRYMKKLNNTFIKKFNF